MMGRALLMIGWLAALGLLIAGFHGYFVDGTDGLSRHVLLALLASLLLLCQPLTSAAKEFAGGLRNVTGTVVVVRGERRIFARTGMRVFTADAVRTSGDGAATLVFRDGTQVVVGPDSEVRLDSYEFAPAEERLGMLTEVVRGSALYVTGTLGKLAPEKVAVKTPVSTIGIRGTRFLVRVGE